MRIILAVIILATVAWCGYWVIGARSIEASVGRWIEERAQDGWVVSNSGILTGGFPYRFDTSISDLELADPDSGLAWSAPLFQILALSYQPGHVIAFWPDRQMVATPDQKITVTSANMRGSLSFANMNDLLLDRATIEFDTVGLASTLGWNAALDHGQLALRRSPGAENGYDIAFETRNLTVPGAVSETLVQRGLASDRIEALTLSATVFFDAPWDRAAIEDRRPQPRHVKLDLAQLSWGQLDLKLAGTLDIDDTGIPSGEITVKATNWHDMLDLARQTGFVPEAIYPLVESGLKALARLSGNPKTIDAPLRFRNGQILLGGLLPLGPAPRLLLR